MKIKLSITIAALLFFGCASTSEPKPATGVAQVVEDTPPNASNECRYGDLSIEEILDKTLDNGLLKVQINGLNKSNTYYQLEYRIVWLDKDGFVIKSLLSKWQSAPAYASSPFYVNAIAPSPKAKKYRVYIRKNQEEIQCNTQDEQTDGY